MCYRIQRNIQYSPTLYIINIQGKIQNWYKKKGDLIKKDDVLCDIETEVRPLDKNLIYTIGFTFSSNSANIFFTFSCVLLVCQ